MFLVNRERLSTGQNTKFDGCFSKKDEFEDCGLEQGFSLAERLKDMLHFLNWSEKDKRR